MGLGPHHSYLGRCRLCLFEIFDPGGAVHTSPVTSVRQVVMSDKSKPELPWYASGLAFECTQCGNCCSGPASGFVWVDDREIEAMAREMQLGDDLDTFRRRFVRQVGLRQSLVEYADGDCIFLDPDTRRCAVYSSRPSQCRSWPFWDRNLQSPQAWKATAQHCPGCNGGPVHSLDVIESIRSMKKAT